MVKFVSYDSIRYMRIFSYMRGLNDPIVCRTSRSYPPKAVGSISSI